MSKNNKKGNPERKINVFVALEVSYKKIWDRIVNCGRFFSKASSTTETFPVCNMNYNFWREKRGFKAKVCSSTTWPPWPVRGHTCLSYAKLAKTSEAISRKWPNFWPFFFIFGPIHYIFENLFEIWTPHIHTLTGTCRYLIVNKQIYCILPIVGGRWWINNELIWMDYWNCPFNLQFNIWLSTCTRPHN